MVIIGGLGGGNDVVDSGDGVNWHEAIANAAFSARDRFGAIVFKKRIYVMGG